MAKTTITKNLTFSKVVAKKAAEIRADTGEKWAVMCARLINEEYERKITPCRHGRVPAPTTSRVGTKSSEPGHREN